MKLQFDITQTTKTNLDVLKKRLGQNLSETIITAFALLDLVTDPDSSVETINEIIENLRK